MFETVIIILMSVIMTIMLAGFIVSVRSNRPKKTSGFFPINWDNDSILLDKMIGRKVNPVIKFYIEVYSDQKSEMDMITDVELDDIYNKTSIDIYGSLNRSYIDYLETVYLGKNKVIEYIAEEVYYLLSISAIGKNNEKASKILTKNRTKAIQKLNQR